MIYITVELNKDIYIKIPKVKEGISPYTLTMTSQAGGQQMVFTDLVNNSDKSSVFRFTLNFTQYTPSGIYNYILTDTADKQISKGLVQVNMTDSEDYFYQDDELGYFVEDEGGGGDMSNYYTKSQIDSMLTQYEKKSDLPDFNNFVTLDQLTSQSYVTTEEMQTEVESYINSKDLINSTQLANTLEWYVTLNELQGMGYVTASELPTVNDATVTVKQGGNVMGSFTLNQSNNVEILLNEGGQGGEITMNDVKQYVDSQGYVMSSSLDSMSYVTSDYLDNAGYVTSIELSNAGYITTQNVRDNYYNKPETEANFTSYAYIEERISRIPGGGITMDDVKQYVDSQSYVTSTALDNMGYATTSDIPTVNDATVTIKQGGDVMGSFTLNQANNVEILLNEGGSGGGISMNDVKQYVDSQSYVTSDYLASQSYIKSNDLNNYVTKTELENCTYVTKNALEGNYYSKTDINAMGYITSSALTDYATKSYVQEKINEIPAVDLSSYVTYTYLEERISQIPGGGISMDDVKNYVVSQSYVTSNELSNTGYITSDYLTSQSYLKSSDLINYVTKTDLTNQSYVISSTLNDYATKSYVQEKINEIPGVDLSSYVKYSDLNNYGYINAQYIVNQSYVTNSDLTNYATKSYVQEKINEIPGVDLSAYVTKTDLVNQSYAKTSDISNAGIMIKQGGVLKGSFNLNQPSAVEINLDAGGSGSGVTMEEVKQYVVSQSYVTSNELSNAGYVTSSTLNDYVSNNNLNQILIGYATKAYVQGKVNDIDLSSYVKYSDLNNYAYVTKTDLVNQSYITSSALTDYATKAYVQEKINEIPGQDLSGYVTKTDLVNQSYITSSALTDYATKAYVETKIAGIDLSSYVTKTDLVNQSYITSSALTDYATKAYVETKIAGIDLSSYVTKSDLSAQSYVTNSDLNNCGYQTSTQVQNTVNTSINSLNSYTLVFTLADDSTVTVIAYTK